MHDAFSEGEVSETGMQFDSILPPTDIFSPNGERQKLRRRVYQKLCGFFSRFFSISAN